MRLLVALMLSLSMGFACADPVPKGIASQIRVLKIDRTELNSGVLRVVYHLDVLNLDVYRHFVDAHCMPLLMASGTDGWDGANIQRVEVMNSIEAQGFAFVGGRKACAGLGNVSGGTEAKNRFIDSATLVCVAGQPCRNPRPGELSGKD